MKKLLDVKGMNVVFQARGRLLHAVRGIDFSLTQGETVGLVGESGCGKSAAVRAIVKLLPQASQLSGEIWYNNENLIPFSESRMQTIRRNDISIVLQDSSSALNPTIKVGKQILEGFRSRFRDAPQEAATQAVLELIHLLGIVHAEEFMEAYPYSLSGGMRQRAMIAAALASEPKILLADEPTTALDVTIQGQVLNYLKKKQAETKMGILFITHDLGLAAHFCDRVLVMYAGKIVECAPVDDLYHHPQHPYTQRLLQAIPHMHQDKESPLIPIDGSPPDLSRPLNYCSFCKRCDKTMTICTQAPPPLYQVSETQWSACYKHHPRCQL